MRAIYAHTRHQIFDCAVINVTPATPSVLRRYRAQGAEPVNPSLEELDRMGLRYVTADLLDENGVVRHDQGRLAKLLLHRFVKRPDRR